MRRMFTDPRMFMRPFWQSSEVERGCRLLKSPEPDRDWFWEGIIAGVLLGSVLGVSAVYFVMR